MILIILWVLQFIAGDYSPVKMDKIEVEESVLYAIQKSFPEQDILAQKVTYNIISAKEKV